jgi:CRP-like cAMP-binding protein
MAFSRLDFEYGDRIFDAGCMADCAYVIRSGKVCIVFCFLLFCISCCSPLTSVIPFHKVGADFCWGKLEVMSDLRCVGFTELFAQRPYQESLRALGSVQAYRLTWADVVDLLEGEEFEGRLANIRRSASAQFDHIRKV